jgi:hypothetical protein
MSGALFGLVMLALRLSINMRVGGNVDAVQALAIFLTV